MMDEKNTIIMRKFLSEDGNAFVDVRHESYEFDRGGWEGAELTVYDGYKSISFSTSLSRGSEDAEMTGEYEDGMATFEALKAACNAAMDELTDCYGRIQMDSIADGSDDQLDLTLDEVSE
jgi:hypothetical protein